MLKLEFGLSVRWETLHIIFVVGLNIQAGTSVYESLHRLWMQQRQDIAEARPEEHATKKLSNHAASAVRKFRILIHDLDEPAIQKILAAASREAEATTCPPCSTSSGSVLLAFQFPSNSKTRVKGAQQRSEGRALAMK